MRNPSIPDPRESISIPAADTNRIVWLQVGTLIDGNNRKPIRDAHIVYNSRTILFVGDAETPPPANVLSPEQREPDLRLPNFTLLPGLIEAHAHLFLEGGELDASKRSDYLKQTPGALLAAARSRLHKLLQLGIVAVRDAGDKDGVGLALSKLYRSDDRPLMPYIDSPGAAIHHKGRYGSFMAEPMENFDSIERCVEARVNAGADRIKLIPTGIINFKQGAVTSEPQMTTEEVSEIVRTARNFGRQTFAHASGDAGIQRALDGGVDSIEHGFFVRDDQLAEMRDRQIAWVPTFAPVQEQVDRADLMGWDETVVTNLKKILDQHAASLVRAHELGVQIIAGSDAGSYGVAHGLGLLREMELMEVTGLAPIDVINTATGNSSNRLAFRDKFGQIKPGFQSRFILTQHSPLRGISQLQREKFLIFDDRVLGPETSLDLSTM
jgi:imidazolonepropionase-like amidohydrolase